MVAGMLAGLSAVLAVVIWERVTFAGLVDFAHSNCPRFAAKPAQNYVERSIQRLAARANHTHLTGWHSQHQRELFPPR